MQKPREKRTQETDNMTSLYAVLGVDESCSADELKKAYKTLALKHHPDKSTEDGAAERFQEISKAYGVLSDPDRRRMYDLHGVEDGSAPPPDLSSLFHDIFRDLPSSFFGGHTNHQRPLPDDVIDVPLPLRDVFAGATTRVEYECQDMCAACKGTGAQNPSDLITCAGCGGRGQIHNSPAPFIVTSMTCPSCSGVGRMIRTPCAGCKGGKLTYQKRCFDIKIPAGVPDGFAHAVAQKGAYDLSHGRHRNLVMRFNYSPESGLSLDSQRNVTMNLEVSLEDLLCGFSRTLTVHDRRVRIVVPSYINPDKPIVVKSLGLPDVNGQNHADLFIKIVVAYPESGRLAKYQELLCKMLKRPFPPVASDEGGTEPHVTVSPVTCAA